MMDKNSSRKQAKRTFKKSSKKARALEPRDFFSNTTFHFRPQEPIPVPVFIARAAGHGNMGLLRANIAALIVEADELLVMLGA